MPTTSSRPGPARRGAQGVTTARLSPEVDRHRRMRSYLIAMLVRTISFPLAVWAFTSHQLVIGWILVVLAVFIPSIAVGVANAVDHRGEGQEPLRSPVQGLGPARPAEPQEPGHPAPTVVPGTVVQGTVVEGSVVRSQDAPTEHPTTR